MRSVPAILVAALCAAATVPMRAVTETVTGQVIDLACYMLDKSNTGVTHRGRGYACAQACAKEGFQVGLVAAEGKVYSISGGLAASKNAKLVPQNPANPITLKRAPWTSAGRGRRTRRSAPASRPRSSSRSRWRTSGTPHGRRRARSSRSDCQVPRWSASG